jgi:hypothetical protein
MFDVRSELMRHLALKQRILTEYPEIDEETLHDTLDGCTTLDQCILALARSVRADEAMIEALENRMTDLKERANRFQARADKARQIIADAMAQAGMKKITAEDVTLSLKPTPAKLIVTDEAQIPEDYLIWTSRFDKALMKTQLAAGAEIPGATLGNGNQTVSMRFK